MRRSIFTPWVPWLLHSMGSRRPHLGRVPLSSVAVIPAKALKRQVGPEGPLELGKRRAPPAGLEPAPPAPEAGALSAELRGRELYEQGTMVLARRPAPSLPSRDPRMLPYSASPCRRTTLSPPRRWSVTSCRARRRSTNEATCTWVASTCSSSSSSSAPRCSSTTRRIYARPVVRRSPLGVTGSPMPPRPSCAAPWPGWPTKRACTSTWRRAASNTSRCPPVSPPSG